MRSGVLHPSSLPACTSLVVQGGLSPRSVAPVGRHCYTGGAFDAEPPFLSRLRSCVGASPAVQRVVPGTRPPEGRVEHRWVGWSTPKATSLRARVAVPIQHVIVASILGVRITHPTTPKHPSPARRMLGGLHSESVCRRACVDETSQSEGYCAAAGALCPKRGGLTRRPLPCVAPGRLTAQALVQARGRLDRPGASRQPHVAAAAECDARHAPITTSRAAAKDHVKLRPPMAVESSQLSAIDDSGLVSSRRLARG